MGNTVEQKVGDAILQKNREVAVGTQVVLMAPPTVATLILASEAISKLPEVELNDDKIAEESLAIARHCRPLGEVVAILLLGWDNLLEERKVTKEVEREVEEVVYRSYLWGLFKRPVKVKVNRIETVEETVTVDRKAELTEQLLGCYSPRELHQLTAELIREFQLGDFFGLTTFLIGVNMLRPTKVAE